MHRIFVPTKHESCSANEFDNSRHDYQGQDTSRSILFFLTLAYFGGFIFSTDYYRFLRFKSLHLFDE